MEMEAVAEADIDAPPAGDDYQAMEMEEAPPPPLLRRQSTTF
jgi:hypothetical protein